MTPQKRPRRDRKADRVLHPDATAEQIRCDYAVAPFDRLARQMDVKWGTDRLPELVSTETAARFGKAMAALNVAIAKFDPDDCAEQAANAVRGLQFMDSEAEAAGQPHSPADLMEYDLDGFRVGIYPEGRDWRAVQAARPDLRVFTMREAAVALQAFTDAPLVKAVKANFPAAEITSIREKANRTDDLNDKIPF